MTRDSVDSNETANAPVRLNSLFQRRKVPVKLKENLMGGILASCGSLIHCSPGKWSIPEQISNVWDCFLFGKAASREDFQQRLCPRQEESERVCLKEAPPRSRSGLLTATRSFRMWWPPRRRQRYFRTAKMKTTAEGGSEVPLLVSCRHEDSLVERLCMYTLMTANTHFIPKLRSMATKSNVEFATRYRFVSTLIS